MRQHRRPAGLVTSLVLGSTAALTLLATAIPVTVANAAPLAATAAAPLTCEELGGDAVIDAFPEALSTGETVTIYDDDLGFDTARFADGGGTACTWMLGRAIAFITMAYAPVDAAQAAAAIGDLEAAGLVRTDTPEGTRFAHPDMEQAEPLDGQHLIGDGLWVVVRAISVGSGGRFIVDDPGLTADADALRERVRAVLPAAATPTPTPPPPVAAPTPDPTPAPTPEPAAELTADEPSVLSGLAPAGAAPVTVASVASTAGTVLVLAALVAIPNRLVDLGAGALADRRRSHRTSETGVTDRIRRLVRAIERRLHPAAGIGIGLVAAGVLTALIDPRAGATLGTLRLAASSTLGYLVEGVLGLLAIAWLLRRDGASVGVRFRPVSLLIVLGAIVLSRIVAFEPGFVFGVVLALVFLRPSAKHEQRAALIEVGWLAGLGVAAWLAYSAIATNAPPTGALGLLGLETLAGLTVGCLMALPLLLSPVGELPGRVIWHRSRLLWAAVFAVATALVVWVVMPFPAAWDAVHTPVVAWVVVLVAYTAGAAAFWVWATRSGGSGVAEREAGTAAGTEAEPEPVAARAAEAEAEAEPEPDELTPESAGRPG